MADNPFRMVDKLMFRNEVVQALGRLKQNAALAGWRWVDCRSISCAMMSW